MFLNQKTWIIINYNQEREFSLIQIRKNGVIWTTENPGNICEVKQQGTTKVMAWAGIVDGRVSCLFSGSIKMSP